MKGGRRTGETLEDEREKGRDRVRRGERGRRLKSSRKGERRSKEKEEWVKRK